MIHCARTKAQIVPKYDTEGRLYPITFNAFGPKIKKKKKIILNQQECAALCFPFWKVNLHFTLLAQPPGRLNIDCGCVCDEWEHFAAHSGHSCVTLLEPVIGFLTVFATVCCTIGRGR